MHANGKETALGGYLIADAHYVKLRDLAAKLNFSIQYSATDDSVRIDTAKAYTPT